MKRLAVVVFVIVVVMLLPVVAAHACSRPQPPTLEQILDPEGGGRA